MKITSVADLTAKQISYSPNIDRTPRPTPQQGETTPDMSNPTINQGSTTPTAPNPNIRQGETDPVLPNVNIEQGSTDPILPNPNIVQGSTTPTLSNPNINQGSTTPTMPDSNIVQGSTDPVLPNPIINQGSTDVILPTPNIEQGITTPNVINPNIVQGSTDPILPDPNIQQGSTTPILPDVTITQGSTTPTLPNPTINQGSTDPVLPNPIITQGSTTPTLPNPTINQGSTTPVLPNPNIVQGSTTPILPNPNIVQGSTDPILPNVNIQQGSTTPTPSNPNIVQGSTDPILPDPNIIQGDTTPTPADPNIVQGSTDPVLPNPNIIQGSSTPTLPDPNIVQGSTDPVLPNPNIVQGSTDPILSNPIINQGSTTPVPSNPNINQGSTTPIPSNPNIQQGSTTPSAANPSINQGSTTPIPPNPNIQQGSTTPSVLNPNINQGSTTPTPSNPIINQGSTTPTPSNPIINQGSTTPTLPNPNIQQGSTTPTLPNPNIQQGSTTPTPSNPNIQQGSTTPTPSNPNIQQGSTTPIPSNPNINQGSTTPSVIIPIINQGSTTPSVLTPNIQQGSTTPIAITPNIQQGSTTPIAITPNIQQGSTTPIAITPNIQQGGVTPILLTPNIQQGATLVNTSPGNWLSPQGGTFRSEQFARNELQLTVIPSVGVLNSVRAAQAVDPLPFTTPILGESINSLAGFNVPIIGGTSIGPLISSLAGGGLGVSIALYMASLPLTLYRRAEGALIIANIAATVAYTQMKIKDYANSKTPRLIDDNGDVLNSDTTLYAYNTGPVSPDPNVDNMSAGGSISVGQGSVNHGEPEFQTGRGGAAEKGAEFSALSKEFKNVGEGSSADADKYIPYMNPTIFQGGIGNNGGPATARSENPTAPGGWATLPYEDIASRAEQSRGLNGTPLPESFSSIIPNVPKPTDTVPGGKRLKYAWMRTDQLNGADQINDRHIVDNMMKYNSFQESNAEGMDDFIKFYFTDLRTGKTFQFRSYLENISDRFNPNWSDIQYIGRPNPLKMYSNTTRDVTLDFIVPALSKQEMKMMYNKLTKLANLTIPTGVGIMQAPMMKFTVGDWFVNEVGHITSLTFSVEDNYTWEINVENDFVELPHIVKVSMGIYVIGNHAMETNKYKIFGPNAYSNRYFDETDSDTLANNPTDSTFRDQITPATTDMGSLSPMQDFGDGIMPTSDWVSGQVYGG